MALFGSKNNKEDNKTAKPDSSVKKVVKSDKKEEKESGSMKDLYSEGGAAKASTKKGKTIVKFSEASRLLVRPLVTEKATTLAASSKYVFVVDKKANKISVTKAIESVYGVKAMDVNIINMKGKRVARGKIKGKRKDWKKAIVTLAKGETIAIYEGV